VRNAVVAIDHHQDHAADHQQYQVQEVVTIVGDDRRFVARHQQRRLLDTPGDASDPHAGHQLVKWIGRSGAPWNIFSIRARAAGRKRQHLDVVDVALLLAVRPFVVLETPHPFWDNVCVR
jgi:hypothetical protein